MEAEVLTKSLDDLLAIFVSHLHYQVGTAFPGPFSSFVPIMYRSW